MVSVLSSLRLRVAVLVILAVLPAAALLYYSAQQNRNDSGDRVRQQALQFARSAAEDYASAVGAARGTALTLAELFAIIPDFDILNDETCAPFFDRLIDRDPRFTSVSLADPAGTVLCGGPVATGVRPSVADASFFRAAIDEQHFALSIDRPAGAEQPSLTVSYPITDVLNGAMRGVLFLELDLIALSNEAGSHGVPDGANVTFAAAGVVIGRFPEPELYIGQPLPDGSALRTVAAIPGGSSGDGTNFNGEAILFAGIGIAEASDVEFAAEFGDAAVAVGIPKSVAYAGINDRLRNDLLLLAGVTAIAAVAGWFGAGLGLRELKRYAGVARAFAAGDSSARTGPGHPGHEVGDLGRAFDDMADAVVRRDQEIRALNESLERRVASRTAELEAANHELEAFSYSVSHDLRAPLRAIDGFSRIILEDYASSIPEEGQRYFRLVRSNARQMGDLVDDLLKFSRLSRATLNRKLVRIDDLARDWFERARPHLNGRTVEFQVDDGMPACLGDEALLRQVMANLLDNALKFTRDTPVTRIRAGFEATGTGVRYLVQDNGAGFNMDYRDKLFGVFQRLHPADQYDGTGVGLAIVQRIIHRHGGEVAASGSPGQGATFSFTVGTGVEDVE